MEFAFLKTEARQTRYRERAAKARKWARYTRLLMFVAVGATIWLDENLNARLQKQAYVALEKIEQITGNESGAGKFVQLALSKLNL